MRRLDPHDLHPSRPPARYTLLHLPGSPPSPRSVMERISSISVKNGFLHLSRPASGTYSSTSAHQLPHLRLVHASVAPTNTFNADTRTSDASFARESYADNDSLTSQLSPTSKIYLIIHHVHLVRHHHDRRAPPPDAPTAHPHTSAASAHPPPTPPTSHHLHLHRTRDHVLDAVHHDPASPPCAWSRGATASHLPHAEWNCVVPRSRSSSTLSIPIRTA